MKKETLERERIWIQTKVVRILVHKAKKKTSKKQKKNKKLKAKCKNKGTPEAKTRLTFQQLMIQPTKQANETHDYRIRDFAFQWDPDIKDWCT